MAADYTLSAKITGDDSGFQKAVQGAQKAAQNFDKVMSGISSKLKTVGSGMQNAGKQITAVSVAFGGALGVGVKYNATVEQLETSFAVMTGSAEEAADIVAKLQKIGASTPFEFTDLANTTNMLMQFGFTAEESISSMQMLGDISQGSAEKMDSIARAYGKMHSSGKVSLEDINMMIDAGFNPLQQISQQTGESMESLYDRISNGTMSVEEITTAMQNATSEGGMYFQSMQQQSQTFSGQMSTLGDNVKTFLGNISSGMFEKLSSEVLPKINEVVSNLNTAFETGGFQGMIDYLGSISPTLDTIITKIQTFSTTLQNMGIDPAMFAGFVVALGPALIGLGKVTSLAGSAFSMIGTLGSGLSTAQTAISGFATSMRAAGSSGTVLSGVLSTITSPIGIVVLAIGAAVAAFAYLMATNDSFRNSIMQTVTTVATALQPVLTTIIDILMQIGGILLNTITTVLQMLAPVIAQIVGLIGQILVAVAPLIQQLLTALMPIVMQIMTFISDLIIQLMPPIITLINAIMSVVQALMPPIMQIISVVVDVITSIMQVVSPILDFVMGIISSIISIITPIIEFVAHIISTVMGFISPLISFFADVFGAIFGVVSDVFGKIGDFIGGVFKGIQNVWNGLVDFVGGIIDGIRGAFDTVANLVKGVINGVIDGINGAIWVINLIPGVNIDPIGHLLHGTDNWQGGFAYMNEGGRGELTYLPNGSQVIPHDLSVRYMKESAKANAQAEPLDVYALGAYIVEAVTAQGEQIANGVQNGIGKMRMVANNREQARFIADLGFVRG